MRFIALSMVAWTGILVTRVRFVFLIWETKEKKYLSKSNHKELKVKEDHKGNGQDYN